jgi:mannose-6-phosphate isomerase
MTLTGEPNAEYFRTFVQARHIFSFVQIGKLGWSGPWRDLVGETTKTLIRRAKRPDGFFVHSLDVDANALDQRADLYDQAFVLFALGTAGGALGRSDWFDEAEALLDRLEANWSHPLRGFREGEIVDARIRRQNPHMHLLEAFLALAEASGRERFKDAARSIAALASEKFIDRTTGALLEYFTDELEPASGLERRIAEPGHCFEWAWLFERLAASGWARGTSVSDRLTEFARTTGIDAKRNVAFNEVLTDGSPHDLTARLWPQTERLKAAVARFKRLGSEQETEEAVAAARGLRQYLQVEIPGLWRDKLREDGSWVEEMAPGSSLYHISCAHSELLGIGRGGSKQCDC